MVAKKLLIITIRAESENIGGSKFIEGRYPEIRPILDI